MLAADVVLAVVFLAAAVMKLLDPDAFALSIRGYLILPPKWVPTVAIALPVFEMIWATLLLVGRQRALSRLVLLLLLSIFTAATISALWRGLNINCGCFGSGSPGSAWWVIGRNLLLFTMVAGVHAWANGSKFRVFVASFGRKVGVVTGSFVLAGTCLHTTGARSEPPAEGLQEASSVESLELKAGGRYKRQYAGMKDWRGRTMTYWVNLPEGFDPELRYPIFIEWHGKGGSPKTRVFPDTYDVDGHIHVGMTYPQGCRHGTAMLYATPEYVALMRYVYDDVVKHFNGDGDYIFLGGFSAGGYMTTGPGISLLIRAKLRDKLAGVLAGGCTWVSDPRYATGVDVLLWYAKGDPNATDLPRKLPEIKNRAASVTIVKQPGSSHRCMPKVEGPKIRRFLRLHGPAREDFAALYRAKRELNGPRQAAAIQTCKRIRESKSLAAKWAGDILARSQVHQTPKSDQTK